MNRNQFAPPASAPLEQRIETIEKRIALRQASVSTHRAELEAAIGNKLTSPLVLVLAAGAGFAIGQIARPRPVDGSGSGSAPGTAHTAPLLSTLLSVMSLIGPVTAIMAQIKPRARAATDTRTGSE